MPWHSSPDGTTLAASSRDGLTRLWDMARPDEWASFLGRAEAAGPVVFRPDGRSLFTGGSDGSLRRWDATNHLAQAIRTRAHVGPLMALAVSSDGKMLASAGADCQLKLWDVDRQLASWPYREVESKVQSLAISHDGKLLSHRPRPTA